MEPTQFQKTQPRPPVRPPMDSASQAKDPEESLKQVAMSLKDSSIGYMQAKAELAAIETKEAAAFAKQKISLGILTAFFAIFSYALFLMLAYGLILQYATTFISNISKTTTLTKSNTVILIMMMFNILFFLIYLLKLSKKPQEELFSLTKSEFQKDKQWLAEINQTNEN